MATIVRTKNKVQRTKNGTRNLGTKDGTRNHRTTDGTRKNGTKDGTRNNGTKDRTRVLRDRIAPGVQVLFVGINPGLRSAETGHHFAGYSNRFWKLLHESGLVSEPITYLDDDRLPEWGYGITNIVARATAGIDELRPEDYRLGARALLKKIRRHRPAVVALVGVTVWRALLDALDEKRRRKDVVTLGFQDLTIEGARVCVLPNPSGRNATLSYAEMLNAYRKLRLHKA